MRIEIRNNGIKDVTYLIAEGMNVIRRKDSGDICGLEVALGYSYYINGVKQDPPHEDVPEDFEEVEMGEYELSDDEAIKFITDYDTIGSV